MTHQYQLPGDNHPSAPQWRELAIAAIVLLALAVLGLVVLCLSR